MRGVVTLYSRQVSPGSRDAPTTFRRLSSRRNERFEIDIFLGKVFQHPANHLGK
jgi:hypothetical protein